MKKKVLLLSFLAIILLLSLVASLLGRKSQKTEKHERDFAVANKEEVAKNETEMLLRDFPVYPGMKASESYLKNSNVTSGLSMSYETSDLPYQVYSFYKSELSTLGWNLVGSSESEVSYAITFEKGERTGFIGITRASQSTIVSVTIGMNKL